MTFNDKIDKFMKDNNYKDLKKLALDANIPYTTLKDFYDKKSADNSRLSTIRKLAKFMGCSMDYLAYDENENFKSNNQNFANYAILFDKVKDLPKDDLEIINNFVETRKKQIDKELGEDEWLI